MTDMQTQVKREVQPGQDMKKKMKEQNQCSVTTLSLRPLETLITTLSLRPCRPCGIAVCRQLKFVSRRFKKRFFCQVWVFFCQVWQGKKVRRIDKRLIAQEYGSTIM